MAFEQEEGVDVKRHRMGTAEQRSAVIDLFMLANTKLLITTFRSSYSLAAGLMSNTLAIKVSSGDHGHKFCKEAPAPPSPPPLPPVPAASKQT